SAARLARDRRGACVSVALAGGGFTGGDRRLDTRATFASVYVTNLNASEFVDGHVEKVEQVAANIRAAFCPDTTALHRRVRCRIRRCPGEPAVESVRNIKMPNAFEVGLESVSRSNRSIKRNGRAVCVAGNRRRITDILQTINVRNVDQILPSRAVID